MKRAIEMLKSYVIMTRKCEIIYAERMAHPEYPDLPDKEHKRYIRQRYENLIEKDHVEFAIYLLQRPHIKKTKFKFQQK